MSTTTNLSADEIALSRKSIPWWLLKRFTPFIALATILLLIAYAKSWTSNQLGNEAFLTGYLLLVIILGLIALGVRKRMPRHRLGPVSLWQSLHHYAGILCLGAYLLHAQIIPNGWIESTLAFLFWFILITGFASWYVNKTSPKKLRAAGPAILRSDIPSARHAVAEQAYQYAMQAAGTSDSAALADLYRSELSSYFSTPRSLWYQIVPTGQKKRNLLAALSRLDRYLDAKGKGLMEDMGQMVRAKDDLDFQLAIQNRVRLIASIHTVFLGAFVLCTLCHVWLAHSYSSHW